MIDEIALILKNCTVEETMIIIDIIKSAKYAMDKYDGLFKSSEECKSLYQSARKGEWAICTYYMIMGIKNRLRL